MWNVELFAASTIDPWSFTKKRRQCELHTKIAQVIKFHNISLVEKKINSGAWGPPLCMTKTKTEIKTPYSIRKQGKSQGDNGSSRKIDVRKRMVGVTLFYFLNKIKSSLMYIFCLRQTVIQQLNAHIWSIYERTSFVSRMQFHTELWISNKWTKTSKKPHSDKFFQE